MIFQIIISLLPVFIFLILLIVLDSYKLVKPFSILVAIFGGIISALICLFLARFIFTQYDFEIRTYSIYVSPILEEIIKAFVIILLLKSNKIGFMVDAAIYGFAIGSGFAFIENIYYLQNIETSNQLVWIIRGFGTAIMHGSTTAVFALVSKILIDRWNRGFIINLIPGLFLAILFHSIFNQFLLPPVITTLLQLLIIPIIFILIFNSSETILQNWMELSFETDMNLLQMINSGEFSHTKIGKYLYSLKNKFPDSVVVDMFCYLRLFTELAISAKGLLLKREAGFDSGVSQDIIEKFEELKFLQKSIGPTGKLALSPILKGNFHDLWQIYFLEKN